MTSLALALVLLSAVAHASWNFLLKRANNQEVFIWCFLASISVLLWPLAVVLAWQDPIVHPGWWYVLGTSLLHVPYFLFLGRGYAHDDLSLVYPVARGIGPVLVPVLGVLVLDERVAPLAIAGIVAVVVGIQAIYWWGRMPQGVSDAVKFLKEPGIRYAVLTGLVITAYSIWDKVGVRYVNPLLYMYLMSLGTVMGLSPYVLRVHGARMIRSEWKQNARSIVPAGLLTFLGYGLVLIALESSRISYIWPSREIGIVIGVLLGVVVLKEPFGTGRVPGSFLIVLGLVLIALSP